MGIDLFKKLILHSHKFITPSNSNTFLVPKTMSTFLFILDTNVYISNLLTAYVYYYLNDKRYTHILYVAYLNSLCF